MLAKLKGNLLPKDYQLFLLRKIHNLKQKLLPMKEYTEKFYKVNIRAGFVEDNPESVSKYITGLIFEIQDEMNLLCLSSMEETYHFSLKFKQKLARKSQDNSRGSFISKGPMRG